MKKANFIRRGLAMLLSLLLIAGSVMPKTTVYAADLEGEPVTETVSVEEETEVETAEASDEESEAETTAEESSEETTAESEAEETVDETVPEKETSEPVTEAEEETEGSTEEVEDSTEIAEESKEETLEESTAETLEVESPEGEETLEEDSESEEEIIEEIIESEEKPVVPGEIVYSVFHAETGVTEGIVNAIDFSTGRLLILCDNPEIILDTNNIVSNYAGVYLMQYGTAEQARNAYSYYWNKVAAVEADITFAVNDDTAAVEADPLTELIQSDTSEIPSNKIVVALIDTGVKGVTARSMSVIGEDPTDDNGHGTLMFNSIMAIAPNADIVSIKAMDSTGVGTASSIYAAVKYAIEIKADIINISASAYSTQENQIVADVIREAVAAGIKVVCSAGNNGTSTRFFLPANMEEVYVASASDETGKRLADANYGTSVDYYIWANSTSQAAAKLTGYIALYGLENIMNANGEFGAYAVRTPAQEQIASAGPIDFDNSTADEILFYIDSLSEADSKEFFDGLTDAQYVRYWTISTFNFDLTVALDEEIYDFVISLAEESQDDYDYFIWGLTDEEYVKVLTILGTDLPYSDARAMDLPDDYSKNLEDQDDFTADVSFGYASFDAFAEARTGMSLLRTENTLQFYNTFVDQGYLTAGSTIDSIYQYEQGGVGLLDLDPLELFEEAPVYLGADGNYYVVSAMPELNGIEMVDAQPTTQYPIYNDRYTDVVYLGNGVFRIPAERYKYCYDMQVFSDGEGGLFTITFGMRIQTLYGYNPAAEHPTRTITADILYPDGTERFAPVTVDLLTADATVTLFSEDLEASLASDYFFLAATINKGQSNVKSYAALADNKSITFNVGDGRTAGYIDIVIAENQQAVSRYSTSPETTSAAYLASPDFTVNVNGTATLLNDNYIELDPTSVPKDLKVGDRFIYENAQVSIAAVYDQIDDGYYHIGGVSVPTHNAQSICIYKGGGEAAVESWYMNGGPASTTSPDPGFMQKMTVDNMLVRAGQNDVSMNLNYNNILGYISQSLGKTTTNGKTLDLENARLVLACMHAWNASYTTTPQGVVNSIAALTGRGDLAIDEGYGFYHPNIALQVTDITNDGTYTYVTLKVMTSLLEVGSRLHPNNYQNAFAVVRLAYKRAGYAQIQKVSSNTTVTNNNGSYSKAGIQYRVYTNEACTTRANDINGNAITLTCGADGNSNVVNMAPGTYYVKEYSVPSTSGYVLSSEVHSLTVTSGSTSSSPSKITVSDAPITGYLRARKVSSNTTLTNNNSCYNYSDIQFKVYTDSACTKLAKDVNGNSVTLTSGKDGYTGTAQMPIGTYYVQEVNSTVTGKGWYVSSTAAQATVTVSASSTSSSPATAEIKNIPMDDPVGITIQKVDDQGKIIKGYDLSGAQYTIKYYNGQYTLNTLPAAATATWVIETKYITVAKQYIASLHDEYIVSGSAVYGKDAGGNYKIPLGTVTIQETKAPKGFTTDSRIRLIDPSGHAETDDSIALFQFVSGEENGQVKFENGTFNLSDGLNLLLLENYSKGGIEITKNDAYSGATPHAGASFAGIKFAIINDMDHDVETPSGTYASKGEIVTVITSNANGKATTGLNDIALGDYKVVELQTDDMAKVGETLTRGTSGMANGDYRVSMQEYSLTVNTIGELQSLDKSDKPIIFSDYLDISTTTKDAVSGTHYADGMKAVKLIDTIAYTHLDTAETYRIEAKLINLEDGSPAVDKDGKAITKTMEFKPSSEAGTVDVVFDEFLTEKGMQTVVYEYLYIGSTLVTDHEDITDENQQFFVSRIKTLARGNDTEDHVTLADGEVVITDKTDIDGLKVGEHYYIEAALMNVETGEPILDDEGKEVVAKDDFVAENTAQTRNVVFRFKGTSAAGCKTVATVKLYTIVGNVKKEVGSHVDLNDQDETVYIPKIKTTLADSVTGIDHAMENKEVTLQDTVSYDHLLVGKTYTISGYLVNKETGTKIVDETGAVVTGSTTFECTSTSGSVIVEFKFNSGILMNVPVVAFESLQYNGIEVAFHMDITDEDQDTFVPSIHTTAVGSDTNEHLAAADENITIIDTVFYEGLKPNTEYKVDGILMDKTTGSALLDDAGNTVTSSATFTTGAAENGKAAVSGSVDVTFTFSGVSLAGGATTAFETLFTSDKEVAVHHDINDLDQTVYFPDIHTTAVGADTKDHVTEAAETTIIDTVHYAGLKPNTEYRVDGFLMNKATGEKVLDDDGNEILGSTTFTTGALEVGAASVSGDVDVEFTFKGLSLAGTTTVVFETLYFNNIELAVHADISDEYQTVYVPEIHTTLTDRETGIDYSLNNEEVVLQDQVYYSNLLIGKSYEISGYLVNKKTGEAIVDGEGNMITGSTKFECTQETGSVIVEFRFNSAILKTQPIVAFESLKYGEIEVAVHADITDENQDDFIPGVHTNALDSETLDHVSNPDEEITIIDTVSYEGLKPNTEYRVNGILMDKETGNELLDDEGNTITGTVSFTTGALPEGEVSVSGTVDVTFTFSGVTLKNKTAVVFETLYIGDIKIGIHADLSDEDQTIYFPEVHTTATDVDTENHIAHRDEKVTIRDEVVYKNLKVGDGKAYTVTGTVMVKETGEPLKNSKGKVVEKTVEFIPETPNGTVIVEFEIDTTLLEGKHLVVFEDLQYIPGISVFVHADLEDEDQTVEVPSIGTTATDKASGSKKMTVTTKIELAIIDKVEFTGLNIGETYTVKGEIYDKTTGKTFGVTAEQEFVPETRDGSVDVEFTLELSKLYDTSLVVFEEIYDAKGNLLAEHKDASDEGQTVEIYLPVGEIITDGPVYEYPEWMPIEIKGIKPVYFGILMAGTLTLCAVAAYIITMVLRRKRENE